RRHLQHAFGRRLRGELQVGVDLRQHLARWIEVWKNGVGDRYQKRGHGYRAIASSMCSIRVKTTGPSAVTSTFSSRRHVCSRYGWPANVSIAKYMFSLIGAGYFIEYARDIHIPS